MLLQRLWCRRVGQHPLLGYVAAWDQEDKVTGQSLLAQCSCLEMLEKPHYTSRRENCPSSKVLLGSELGGPLAS